MTIQETRVRIPYIQEQAIHKTCENGYQFIHVPRKGDVFNISTWVKTGSIHETDKNNGISHFLEHLLFKGTERFGAGEFDKAMESMGAVINAATWKDFTFYYITGPKGHHNKNFQKAMDMHADMMLFSAFPEEEIGEPHDPFDPNTTANKRERGVVIEEIAMREDQPWTKVYNTLNHLMYPEGHPYRRDVIGTRKIIGNIPREEIVGYYHQWYGPETMCTIVVGDFDTTWLEDQILQCFDFTKQRRDYRQYAPQPQTQNATSQNGTSHHVALTGDTNTSFLMLGFHGPKPADLKATIAVDVASRILGEGRSSRLYQAFIERPAEPIFNMISCGQSTFRLGNTFYVQGNFNSADADGVLAAVQEEIKHYLTDKPVTAEEFERVLKKMKTDFAETSETASGIAESIGESITVTDTLDEYVRYLDILHQLTLDDVRQATSDWMDLSGCYSTTMVPKGAV